METLWDLAGPNKELQQPRLPEQLNGMEDAYFPFQARYVPLIFLIRCNCLLLVKFCKTYVAMHNYPLQDPKKRKKKKDKQKKKSDEEDDDMETSEGDDESESDEVEEDDRVRGCM